MWETKTFLVLAKNSLACTYLWMWETKVFLVLAKNFLARAHLWMWKTKAFLVLAKNSLALAHLCKWEAKSFVTLTKFFQTVEQTTIPCNLPLLWHTIEFAYKAQILITNQNRQFRNKGRLTSLFFGGIYSIGSAEPMWKVLPEVTFRELEPSNSLLWISLI